MTKILLDTKEAAAIMFLSKNYLEKLRCNGKGPKFIRVGKYVRYSPLDLEEWVNNLRRVSSTSDSIN